MLESLLTDAFNKAYQKLYKDYPNQNQILFQKTRPEFEGDYTIVVFPFTKVLKKSPEAIADELGKQLVEDASFLNGYNVIKGFLNLVVADAYWFDFFKNHHKNDFFRIA